MYKNITSWLSNLSKGGTFTTWSRVWLRRIWQANELFFKVENKKLVLSGVMLLKLMKWHSI